MGLSVRVQEADRDAVDAALGENACRLDGLTTSSRGSSLRPAMIDAFACFKPIAALS